MKKVLAILAVVGFASFGFADEPVDIGTNMASFEGLTLNEDDGEGTQVPASGGLLNEAGELDTTADDAGQSDGPFFWYLPGTRFDAELIVTPYETNADGVISYNYDAHGFDGSLFSGVQSNYLSICTVDQPLSRSVLPRMAQTTTAADIGNGIYIDTLIQFQPSEVAPTVDMGTDQLLVWMQEVEADEGADIEAATNLVVTAAYLKTSENQLDASNYVVTVANTTVNPGEWHRLTVKSIKDISTDSRVAGFVVFIDGQVATSTESRGVTGSAMSNLNPAAADWAEQNALFPGLMDITYADKNGKLAAVSFDGTGAIDDLSIARSAPFPGANDKTRLRIEITEGVTAVTVTWGTSGSYEFTDADIAAKVATVVMQEPGNVVATVTATYDEDNGWKKHKDGWQIFEESCVEGTNEGEYVIALGTMGDILVKAFQPKFMVGDEEFDSLDGDTGAIAAAADRSTEQAPGTIKLLANYAGQVVIPEGAYIVLDLAGKTIQGVYNEENPTSAFTIYNQGWLKIIDSTATAESTSHGQVCAPRWTDLEEGEIVGRSVYNIGTLSITAGKYDGNITNVAEIEEEPTGASIAILGGIFYDPDYNPEEQESEFIYEEFLVDGKNLEATSENCFWMVVDGTVGTLTIPAELPTGIASMTVYQAATDDASDWGNALTGDGNVYSITAGNYYKVVVTPAAGYQLKDSLKNAIISDAAVVVDGEYEVKAADLTALVEAVPTVDYTITDNATVTLAITNDGVETVALEGFVVVGKTLTITATAIDGYAFSGEEVTGWAWDGEAKTYTFTTTAVAGTPITATVPTATLIPAANVVSIQVNGGDATGYADVASALAAVQAAEGDAANFPIVVTALANDGIQISDGAGQTVSLAKDETIIITAGGWAFSGGFAGHVVLQPGKSITIAGAIADGATITAPAGYMIVKNGNTYTAEAILATVKIGDADAVNFCDLNAVLAAVQEAEQATEFQTIVVTAVGAARMFELGEQSITLGKDETITIAKAGSWQFSNLFVGKVLLVAGNEIIAKGIADGSEILVDAANGYELKASDPADEYYTYTAELKTLTATFYDDDAETVLYQDTAVVYGTVPEYKGETPAKTDYTFAGWDKEIVAITENTSYVATYTPNPATLTLPASATGVATMTVYESDDGKATWKPVTAGGSGAYSITAGNFYKVAVTAAQDYELVSDGELVSQAVVTAGAEIAITVEQLTALVKQTATDPWADVVDDDISDVTDENRAQVAAQLEALKTAGGFTDVAATKAWLEKFYGSDNKLSAETLLAAKNLGISTKYDLPLMTAETPTIEFNATAAATDGNVAAFTFQIKDGATPVSLEQATAKVLSMIQYCSTLGSWGAATAADVAVSVDGTTATVQLKQTAAAAGFMKVVLTADK